MQAEQLFLSACLLYTSGYLIIYSSQTFKLTWVLMSIIILCIIAIILYGLLGLIEKRARR